MNSISILLLGTQMATGGAQKVLLDQARWFHEHGHKVVAAFFYDKEKLHRKWQDAFPFTIYDLGSFHPGKGTLVNTVSLLTGLYRLWNLIRRERFDVIETFTHDSNLLGLPVAWMAGVPLRIATHHGAVDKLPRWREKLHTWIINRNIAHLLVTVSEKTRQNALEEGVDPHRIFVIQNGIAPLSIEGVSRREVRKEAGVEEEDILLLSVGRLVYQKAHEVLLAAMPLVLRECPNVKVRICGDGVLRSHLEEQIEALGLRNTVKLLGKCDNVVKFLAAADIFVLPSRWEGLPIALLEAMSTGLPVVATHVEGVDEVIEQGEHGLLVPIEDAPALANAILQLARAPELRRKMGNAARQRIGHIYTVDRMCERYLQLMLRFLQKPPTK